MHLLSSLHTVNCFLHDEVELMSTSPLREMIVCFIAKMKVVQQKQLGFVTDPFSTLQYRFDEKMIV
jgi:hypothetical protein